MIQSRWFLGFQIVMIALWGSQLLYTDAYYVNYLLILIATGICLAQNMRENGEVFRNLAKRRERMLINLFAVLFALMVAFANYRILGDRETEFGKAFGIVLQLGMTAVFFLGGFFAFRILFTAICRNKQKLIWKQSEKESTRPKMLFLLCFLTIVLTRSIVLFFCRYPGIVGIDSFQQIEQIFSGNYSNHHPFYHTMLIRYTLLIGMKLFRDINAAVATYSVIQILFTGACFSFAVGTMAQMKAPRWMILSSLLFFVLMPYHILYAISMWKDVPWGCVILLFLVAFIRCQDRIGNNTANYMLLAISGLGICLFRSNGLFVFVILTGLFAILWKGTSRKQLVMFVSVIVISLIMKYPVLEKLQVTQPDTIEALSIPAQQIARVVQEGCELTDWEKETLAEIIDIDQIPKRYKSYISDPVKELVREKDNQQRITEKKWDYMKLYFRLGWRYPKLYLRAWIDQTKGYWNAGYDYWRWGSKVKDNEYGIEGIVRSDQLNSMLNEYVWLYPNIQGLRLFLSIGLFVWIDLATLFISLLRKDKLGIFAAAPVLAVVLSLLVATPVYSEFRYIYCAFCTLPIVIAVCCAEKRVESGELRDES